MGTRQNPHPGTKKNRWRKHGFINHWPAQSLLNQARLNRHGIIHFDGWLREQIIPDDQNSFLYSLPYYFLTGRRSAWYFKDKNTALVALAHPNQPNTILLFPELGERHGGLLCNAIMTFLSQNMHIQLARFNKHDTEIAQSLLKNNFIRQNIALSLSTEKSLDWQYPNHIYDIQKIIALDGPELRNIRYRVNRFEKDDHHIVDFFNHESSQFIRSCIRHWESQLHLRFDKIDWAISDFYARFLQLVKTFPGMFDGFITFVNGRACGFTAWHCTNGDTANALVNLTDITVFGLSEFQIVESCRRLHEMGYRYYNRGGSETAGLDEYKRKFMPVKSITEYSLDVHIVRDQHMQCMPLVFPEAFDTENEALRAYTRQIARPDENP